MSWRAGERTNGQTTDQHDDTRRRWYADDCSARRARGGAVGYVSAAAPAVPFRSPPCTSTERSPHRESGTSSPAHRSACCCCVARRRRGRAKQQQQHQPPPPPPLTLQHPAAVATRTLARTIARTAAAAPLPPPDTGDAHAGSLLHHSCWRFSPNTR